MVRGDVRTFGGTEVSHIVSVHMKRSSAQLLLLGTLLVAESITMARPIDSTRIKGAALFHGYCLRCHGEYGTGSVKISDNPVWTKDPASLIRIIAFGARGPAYNGKGYHRGMPPAPYNDEEIALVAMYAMQQIGKRDVTISTDDVRQVRRQHIDSVRRKMDRSR